MTEQTDIVKFGSIQEDDIESWLTIVDDLYDSLKAHDDMPDKVVQAAEMLVVGIPTYKIARELDVSTKTIRRWLSDYPQLAIAINSAKKNITRWRLSMLEGQFLLALKKSEEVLTTSARQESSEEDEVGETVNAKLLALQAQHARYIFSLFLGNKMDLNINIRDETPTMKAAKNALDYLAAKMIEAQTDDEPIEGVVRVIDVENPEGPLLNEDGNPHFGVLGKLDINKDGVLCHVCGKRFERLDIHIRVKERLSNEDYETIFMLSPGAIRESIERDNEQTEDRGSSA